MSEPAQPSIDNAVPEPQADGFWARTWRLTGILAGLIVALPMVMVFGMLRGLRWLARMQPVLARFAWRLAGSPLPARLLALGGMVAALTLALVALGLDGATAWDARIGVLIGVGAALMALPKWLGWPDRTLRTVVGLVLAIGLLGQIARQIVPSFLPAGARWILFVGDVWLVLVLGGGVLLLTPVFQRGRSSLVGTLASGLGGLLLVSLGAECLGLGALAWADLPGGVSGELGRVLLAAIALWIAAFLINRQEARRPYRWAGRLLALRSLLMRLGGLLAGVAAGIWMVPVAGNAAWTAAFGTPLEGLAPAAGYAAGGLTGALIAAIFAALPMLLARLQLSGRLSASAAGEVGWFAALAFSIAIASFIALFFLVAIGRVALALGGGSFEAPEISLPIDSIMSYIVAVVLATLGHTAIRLLLGRVPESPGTALWLFLPETVPAPATVSCALRAAEAWQLGPVTLVAPPPVALKVRGAHLRLAQQAGLLPALFVSRSAQGADWQRQRLPPGKAWNGLPFCELYGGTAAWQAALAEAKTGARILVILGDSAAGWDAGFVKALPAGSELLCRLADAAPGADAGVVRDNADFFQAAIASDWLARFRQRNTPVLRPSRRLLVLHRPDGALLARRLADAMDERIDSGGRQVVASTLDTQPSGQVLLRMDSRTWQTVIGLAARFAASLAAAPKAGLFTWLAGLVARRLVPVSDAQLDLVTLEAMDRPSDDRSTAHGLEGDADLVIALLPADAPAGMPTIYPRAAYTATLRLPPPSALDDAGVAEVARRLLAGEVIIGAPPVRVDSPSPSPARVFLSAARPYAHYRDLLAGALRERGLEVIADEQLKAGTAWQDALIEMFDSCQLQVVLCGPALSAERFVMREVELGLERNLFVIPVVVESFEEPRELRAKAFANRRLLHDLAPEELRVEIAAAADEIARIATSLASRKQSGEAASEEKG